MEDAGEILNQISSLKDIIDQVNGEIEETIASTREIESEIANCYEMMNRCVSREHELSNVVSVAEFELDGLTRVAAIAEASLESLNKELGVMEMNMDEIQGRISVKREEFLALCDSFQTDILKRETNELNALLLKREALEIERKNLNVRISAVQNSTKEYLEEVLEEIHSFTLALEAEILDKNSEKLELSKDIFELKLLLCSIGPSGGSSLSEELKSNDDVTVVILDGTQHVFMRLRSTSICLTTESEVKSLAHKDYVHLISWDYNLQLKCSLCRMNVK